MNLLRQKDYSGFPLPDDFNDGCTFISTYTEQRRFIFGYLYTIYI